MYIKRLHRGVTILYNTLLNEVAKSSHSCNKRQRERKWLHYKVISDHWGTITFVEYAIDIALGISSWEINICIACLSESHHYNTKSINQVKLLPFEMRLAGWFIIKFCLISKRCIVQSVLGDCLCSDKPWLEWIYFWCTYLRQFIAYLRSPKDGCSSISDDLSCSHKMNISILV